MPLGLAHQMTFAQVSKTAMLRLRKPVMIPITLHRGSPRVLGVLDRLTDLSHNMGMLLYPLLRHFGLNRHQILINPTMMPTQGAQTEIEAKIGRMIQVHAQIV